MWLNSTFSSNDLDVVFSIYVPSMMALQEVYHRVVSRLDNTFCIRKPYMLSSNQIACSRQACQYRACSRQAVTCEDKIGKNYANASQ